MSLLAVLYKLVPESPILIAFNREDLVTQKINNHLTEKGINVDLSQLNRDDLDDFLASFSEMEINVDAATYS